MNKLLAVYSILITVVFSYFLVKSNEKPVGSAILQVAEFSYFLGCTAQASDVVYCKEMALTYRKQLDEHTKTD